MKNKRKKYMQNLEILWYLGTQAGAAPPLCGLWFMLQAQDWRTLWPHPKGRLRGWDPGCYTVGVRPEWGPCSPSVLWNKERESHSNAISEPRKGQKQWLVSKAATVEAESESQHVQLRRCEQNLSLCLNHRMYQVRPKQLAGTPDPKIIRETSNIPVIHFSI